MKEKIKGFSDPRLVGREVYVLNRKFNITQIGEFLTCEREDEYGDCYNKVFCLDGRNDSIDLLPSLSFTPYTVTINENGQVTIKGYSDEIELESEDKPKEGDYGWFWDDSRLSSISFKYGVLDNISSAGYYCDKTLYLSFSKTCPDWIKQIINK